MAQSGSELRDMAKALLLLHLLLALVVAARNRTSQAVSSGVKPTKYHYYPHNQHLYQLPECATQQVCNAVFVRLKITQPLCACPGEPCSASLDEDDQHTTPLVSETASGERRALTLAKTCEPVGQLKACRAPRDWALLALQNVRTGKSHYLVVCRCPDKATLEGPEPHDQPTYASVPGIRVFGMTCVQQTNRRKKLLRLIRSAERNPPFPWAKVRSFASTFKWN